MEPVKVPQHLEIRDLIAWGMTATDLVCTALGGLVAWWIYLRLPGPAPLRVLVAVPALFIGLALGPAAYGERSLREWLFAALAYLRRPRLRVYGGDS
jgi:hypothetical protein